MFHGTVIEELFEIVERVEVHAQPIQTHTMEMNMNAAAMYPAFMAELLQANLSMAGVA
jgi:hypothetical protein